jgi:hypothetical protein
MTQMADEIRALIADLYDDPEDFLKTPHQWFGGRSPNELMATEAGQFVLLKFLRGGDHMPPIEPDRDFKPYTAANTDRAIDQTITRLEEQIEQLRALKGSGPEIATVIGRAREVFMAMRACCGSLSITRSCRRHLWISCSKVRPSASSRSLDGLSMVCTHERRQSAHRTEPEILCECSWKAFC